MINPVQTTITQADGSDLQVIIDSMLKKDSEGRFGSTGIFKIYKDAFGDETHLFTESAESDGPADDRPDEENPDSLGKFVFENGNRQHFEGQVLSLAEQAYLAVFIETYPELDI